jgi:hypothetical protein
MNRAETSLHERSLASASPSSGLPHPETHGNYERDARGILVAYLRIGKQIA